MTLNRSLPSRESRVEPVAAFDRNQQWGERYFVGVDLGAAHDPTAICVVRRLDDDPHRSIYQCGHIERVPLGTPYPMVVSHVMRQLARPPLRGKSELIVDYTGVGRPVWEMFVGRGVSPIGVTITAGDAVSNDGGPVWKVPKLILVSRVQALLHNGQLRIHKALPEAPALVAELQDFKGVTDSGYWKFGARAGAHDDLVLALAISLWRAYGSDGQNTGLLEYMRRGGWQRSSSEPTTETAGLVKLHAPAGRPSPTHVQTISGKMVAVAGDVVELTEAVAAPLLAAGWGRLDDAASASTGGL